MEALDTTGKLGHTSQVIAFTGSGKDKTTAAVGVALRRQFIMVKGDLYPLPGAVALPPGRDQSGCPIWQQLEDNWHKERGKEHHLPTWLHKISQYSERSSGHGTTIIPPRM